MSRSPRWPADTKALAWANREEFRRLRGQWLELVRRDAALLPAAKVALAEIGGRFSFDKSHAWPSFQRLAADIATSPKTVQRSVGDGMGRGWLTIERVGFGASNRYTLSASPSTVAQVEAEHQRRVAVLGETRTVPFRSPVSTLEAGPIEVIGDPSLRSQATSHSGHRRPLIEVTHDQLILPSNPPTEFEQGIESEKLGDRVQDETPDREFKDIFLALGQGDRTVGELVVAKLGADRFRRLRERFEAVGFAAMRQEIKAALGSVADEVSSQQNGGTGA